MEETDPRRGKTTLGGKVDVAQVAKPPRPHFLEMIEGTGSPAKYELSKAEIVIGREEGTDLMLPGDHVSRKHALLRRRNQEYTIIDLDSVHGVYLNEIKVHSALLRDEDVLQLAEFVFVYHEA